MSSFYTHVGIKRLYHTKIYHAHKDGKSIIRLNRSCGERAAHYEQKADV